MQSSFWAAYVQVKTPPCVRRENGYWIDIGEQLAVWTSLPNLLSCFLPLELLLLLNSYQKQSGHIALCSKSMHQALDCLDINAQFSTWTGQFMLWFLSTSSPISVLCARYSLTLSSIIFLGVTQCLMPQCLCICYFFENPTQESLLSGNIFCYSLCSQP